MTAEIRDKSSALMLRNELIDIFDRDNVMISVHEHLDQEELFFNNGKSIFYAQSLQEFAEQFSDVALTLDGKALDTFCAAFFSCPIYERFRAVELVRKAGAANDIYFDANNRVLEEIGVLQQAFKQAAAQTVSANVPFLPLPFLFVDPNVPAKDFERQYTSVLDKVAGLKWHPYAQRHEPKSYVQSGYIDLAAEYGLPTVIHCERPDEKGDLSALFRDVSTVAERAKVAIDIAHMGFLHADLDKISDFEYSYIDMSPWSAIATER